MEVILVRCSREDPSRRLMLDLRGKISGRNRVLLADKPDKMRSPLKIADELYVETHYDTETLLRIMTTRILDAVHYDYSNITIAVRNESV